MTAFYDFIVEAWVPLIFFGGAFIIVSIFCAIDTICRFNGHSPLYWLNALLFGNDDITANTVRVRIKTDNGHKTVRRTYRRMW